MKKVTMQKETDKSILTRIINADEIEFISFNKKLQCSMFKFEPLSKYSSSIVGYVHQLLLEGYEKVSV